MLYRTLGEGGPLVSEIGLGCMGMSGMYGPADRKESLATLRAALDAGVTLIDTGDFYGMGHNEALIGQVLTGARRDKAVISVKFGALRGPDGGWLGFDARPAAVKTFVAYSLQRLGVDHIDIYRPARLSRETPIEDTIGAIADLVKAGYVRHIGLSEVGADTIRRAAAVHPICDLQIEYSLLSRRVEDEILPTCRELGIAITAYGVLSRGLLSGHFKGEPSAAAGDFRGMSPRFRGDNLDFNLAIAERLRQVAEQFGLTAAQAAIAWVASRGGDVFPIVGARRRTQLAEVLATLEKRVNSETLAAIERAVPKGSAAGERYPREAMAELDSERRAS